MTSKSRWMTAGVAVAAVSLLLAACGSSSKGAGSSGSSGTSGTSSTTAPAPSGATGVLTGAMSSGAIDTLDPNAWYFAVTWGLANALCTTMIRYADVPGTAGTDLVPGTTDLPTITDNGLLYTYTLRPGARFSDGQAITPADLKYTFLRLMSPAIDTGTGYYFTNVIGANAYLAGTSKTVAGITTTANSLVFHLSAPDGAFEYKTALPTTCPVPVGTVMKPTSNGSIEEKYASGPFEIQSYQPGRKLTLVFNKNYDQALGDRGHVAEIVFDIGVASPQATQEIQAGQLDFDTTNLDTADIIRLSHDPSVAGQIHTSARPDIQYLFLNNQVAPLNNVDVRKAINYAIDRTQILEEWGGPLAGTPTDEITPPALVDYKQYSIYPNTPNLPMAKKLMQESGVKTPVTLGLRVINDEPGFVDMGEVIKADLAPLGIDVNVLGSPNSTNSSIISNYKTHTAMGIEPWSADFPDDDAIINTGLNPADPDFAANFSHFGDPAFIPQFEAAAAALGQTRITDYETLDYDLMSQQAPYAMLFNPRWYDFVSTRLGGYVYSEAMDAINYNTMYVKS